MLFDTAVKKDIKFCLLGPRSEAIKLFSNTHIKCVFYSAAAANMLAGEIDSKEIIEGVSLDPRIGNHYNNPSFDYQAIVYKKTLNNFLLVMMSLSKILFCYR